MGRLADFSLITFSESSGREIVPGRCTFARKGEDLAKVRLKE
jgi:hypothetical protein